MSESRSMQDTAVGNCQKLDGMTPLIQKNYIPPLITSWMKVGTPSIFLIFMMTEEFTAIEPFPEGT
jgi:hypothetical protein